MMDAWDKELEEHYWNPAFMNGAIPICDRGCALRQWLVVSGPQRGYVWNDDRADYGGIYPLLNEEGRPMTFTDWYLSWLLAGGIESVPSAMQNRGDGMRSRHCSDWTYLAAMVVGLFPGLVIGAWWDWPIIISGLASAFAALALVACIDRLVMRMRSDRPSNELHDR